MASMGYAVQNAELEVKKKISRCGFFGFFFHFCLLPSLSIAATDPLGLANGTNHLFVDNTNASCSDSYSRTQALSPNTPWCNIEPAVSNASLQPDDTIYVKGGTYRVSMGTTDPYAAPSDNCLITPVKDGTSGHPITVAAYNNEAVLIDGRADVRDYNGDGAVDQNWNQCHWSSSCNSPCNGIPNQTSCDATWYMNYTWVEGYPYYEDKGQFWQDSQLIPSLTTGNLAGFSTAGRWMKVPASKRIFYRSSTGSSPVNTGYSSCSVFFNFVGRHYWTIDGIDTLGATDTGYLLSYENVSAKTNPSTDITLQNLNVSYDGDNACAPGRDGTYGHGLEISGSSANILVKDSVFTQDVSECVHVSNTCTNRQCGEHFTGNTMAYCGQDPGWNSQCTDNGSFSDEKAQGIIVRSDGGVYEDNTFNNNDGSAFILESENSHGEGLARPSNVTLSRNWFLDNKGAGVEAACVYGNSPSTNNLIDTNVFINNSLDNDFMGQLWLAGNCDDYKLYSNTLISSPYWGIHLSKYDNGDCVWDSGSGACIPAGTEITNNISSYNGRSNLQDKLAEISLCPECLDTSLQYNLIFDTSGTVLDLGNTALACSQISGQSGNNLCQDPKFVDLARRDIHLTANSVAIDSGNSLSSLNRDIDNDLRPQGTEFDIGADEYVVSLSLTPPQNIHISDTRP